MRTFDGVARSAASSSLTSDSYVGGIVGVSCGNPVESTDGIPMAGMSFEGGGGGIRVGSTYWALTKKAFADTATKTIPTNAQNIEYLMRLNLSIAKWIPTD